MNFRRKRLASRKGQTVLEYMMMIAVFVLPLAMVLNNLLKDSEPGKSDNAVQRLVKDSYGSEETNGMGIIGRPYP